MKKSLQIFQDTKIRSHWDDTEKQWYFSVVDVVAVLTTLQIQEIIGKF